MTGFLEQISRLHEGLMQPLEDFASMVKSAGYELSDCVIEHHRADCNANAIGESSTERHVMKVHGQACFELTVHRSAMIDYVFTYTATPRLIAWPPMTAHQVRASSEAGTV